MILFYFIITNIVEQANLTAFKNKIQHNITLTFPQIKNIILEGKLELLGRSDEQLLKYHSFKLSMIEKWDSILDYILETKFNFRTSTG
jgi:hypothetical protein